MSTGFTSTQRERLAILGADEQAGRSFASEAERNQAFTEIEKKLCRESRSRIERILAEKHTSDAFDIQCALERWLIEDMGFTKVATPSIISSDMLSKMSITEDNRLRDQVFWISSNKCLRPMLAPNLYVVMRELHRIAGGPVRIFESGSCFRKETQGAQHLNEFTMLNFVEFAACKQGEQVDRLESLSKAAMSALGIEKYELKYEKSTVYGETLDVEVSGVELASGSFGPHRLDAAWGVFEPWVGVGFGIERIALVKGGHKTIKRVGKSITFIDGVPLSV
ncbi:MAG: pyrrolysine--tRNA(Pyl) ligase large subunit [Clostridiales bacterium]|nr:pyrrolysine--tRNA(Pyl) ligase large subunit [Clostridiales bacterium]